MIILNSYIVAIAFGEIKTDTSLFVDRVTDISVKQLYFFFLAQKRLAEAICIQLLPYFYLILIPQIKSLTQKWIAPYSLNNKRSKIFYERKG